jgi:hypothetical protein
MTYDHWKTTNPDDERLGNASQQGKTMCLDCDGEGRYPSGAVCECCAGSGAVAEGEGGYWPGDEPEPDDRDEGEGPGPRSPYLDREFL